MKTILLTAVAALSLLNISSAEAAMRAAPLPPIRPATLQTNTALQQAGTLTCMLQPGVGFVVGSNRAATCIFDHPGEKSFSQTYEADLTRVGLDVGVMPKQAMRWAVMTPGGFAEPGMLTGAHPGTSAEGAVGVGDGVKVALQDANHDIVFQQMNSPMTFGVSFSFGQANLELKTPSAAIYN
jgi:hypothetical protein